MDRYPDFVALMEAVLGKRSCSVTGLDPDDARVADLVDSQPDLIVIVVGALPNGSARRLLLWARSHPLLRAVPFLVVTTDPSLLPLGIPQSAVITLPFSLQEVVERVDGMLTAPRRRQLEAAQGCAVMTSGA